MVTSSPLENTRSAASGSAQMLNSAAGVTFPSPIAPPIRTIRPTPPPRPGSGRGTGRLRRAARRDEGHGLAEARTARRGSRSRAARPAPVLGCGQRGAVQPALAVDVRGDEPLADERPVGAGRHRDRPHGRRTRAPSARSRSSSRASGCRETVVTPSSSTSGLASASRSAIASSCPGSQSIRMRVDHAREYRVYVRRGREGRLGSEARGGERSGRAGALERLRTRPALEQRDERGRR